MTGEKAGAGGQAMADPLTATGEEGPFAGAVASNGRG